jgi:hypothetical protein
VSGINFSSIDNSASKVNNSSNLTLNSTNATLAFKAPTSHFVNTSNINNTKDNITSEEFSIQGGIIVSKKDRNQSENEASRDDSTKVDGEELEKSNKKNEEKEPQDIDSKGLHQEERTQAQQERPPAKEICNNGKDDDNDGLVDFNDEKSCPGSVPLGPEGCPPGYHKVPIEPICLNDEKLEKSPIISGPIKNLLPPKESGPSVFEPPKEICNNGKDDDGDGLADLSDSNDCKSSQKGPTQSGREKCNNGKDDDGDGLVDIEDAIDCKPHRGAPSTTKEICDNGVDDDNDGLVDTNDTNDCKRTTIETQPTTEICDNGVDDDNDGLVDSEEGPSCAKPKLMVTVNIINNEGGFKKPYHVKLNVTGNEPSPSSFSGDDRGPTSVSLNPGVYSVKYSDLPGYGIKSESPECEGTINYGETRNCNIVFDDLSGQASVFVVVKEPRLGSREVLGTGVIPDEERPAVFTVRVTAGGNPTPSVFQGSEEGTTVTFNGGRYNIEVDPINNYEVRKVGDCNSYIISGESKRCTFLFAAKASLKVNLKIVNPEAGVFILPEHLEINRIGNCLSNNAFELYSRSPFEAAPPRPPAGLNNEFSILGAPCGYNLYISYSDQGKEYLTQHTQQIQSQSVNFYSPHGLLKAYSGDCALLPEWLRWGSAGIYTDSPEYLLPGETKECTLTFDFSRLGHVIASPSITTDSSTSPQAPGSLPSQIIEICNNGKDDDNDGLVDFNDEKSCPGSVPLGPEGCPLGYHKVPIEPICERDQKKEESSVVGGPIRSTIPPKESGPLGSTEEICDNAKDDDNDDLIDSYDEDCNFVTAKPSITPPRSTINISVTMIAKNSFGECYQRGAIPGFPTFPGTKKVSSECYVTILVDGNNPHPDILSLALPKVSEWNNHGATSLVQQATVGLGDYDVMWGDTNFEPDSYSHLQVTKSSGCSGKFELAGEAICKITIVW